MSRCSARALQDVLGAMATTLLAAGEPLDPGAPPGWMGGVSSAWYLMEEWVVWMSKHGLTRRSETTCVSGLWEPRNVFFIDVNLLQ